MFTNQRLNQFLDQLRDAAKLAASRAYCPYSRFRVGAALLLDDNSICAAANVENASYGLTVCAESSAISAAVGSGLLTPERSVVAAAIFTPTDQATAPCGACRQRLNEFGPAAEVLSFCNTDHVLVRTMADLLPDAFGPHNLAK